MKPAGMFFNTIADTGAGVFAVVVVFAAFGWYAKWLLDDIRRKHGGPKYEKVSTQDAL